MHSLGDLFTGQLVRLAAFGPDVKEAMARWSHDAEYVRLLDGNAALPRSVEHFNQEEHHHGHDIEFAIRTLADDKLIGECEIEPQWNHQSAWIGIGIGEPEYRGKGYGTDAVRLLVAYGFRELGLYRVQLGLFGYNQRAYRSYQKAGFVQEVVQREAFYKDGKRYDGYIMGILRPDWERMQQEEALTAQA